VNPFRIIRAHSRFRLVATLLCLLACTLQSFVAQTHVHVRRAEAPTTAGYVGIVQVDAGLPADSDEGSPKHNGRDGTTTCPLCQIVLHGGAAPVPAFSLPLALPAAISVARTEQVPLGAIVAGSFNWQGRAPPLS